MGTSYQVTLTGSGAIAQGEGAVDDGAGDIAVGRRVEGGIHVSRGRTDDADTENK